MDGIDLLKRQALAKRNATILAAKREYHRELKAIKSLTRTLVIKQPGRPRKAAVTEDPMLKSIQVARDILLEGHRMTLRELTLEVQRRGCRSSDEYRVLSHAISAGLGYHRRHFKRDGNGRWAVNRP